MIELNRRNESWDSALSSQITQSLTHLTTRILHVFFKVRITLCLRDLWLPPRLKKVLRLEVIHTVHLLDYVLFNQ
jgi:hypothetical protein